MKPECILELTGPGGNVFVIIGKVSETLKKAGLYDQAAEFTQKAFKSKSYEAVLTLVEEYVEVN
jgi:hypothetical protein